MRHKVRQAKKTTNEFRRKAMYQSAKAKYNNQKNNYINKRVSNAELQLRLALAVEKNFKNKQFHYPFAYHTANRWFQYGSDRAAWANFRFWYNRQKTAYNQGQLNYRRLARAQSNFIDHLAKLMSKQLNAVIEHVNRKYNY
jgi:hypothetical protein